MMQYLILQYYTMPTEIENATKRISEVLKPGGLIFNEEYVGPAQNQYSDEHLKLMIESNG